MFRLVLSLAAALVLCARASTPAPDRDVVRRIQGAPATRQSLTRSVAITRTRRR